ncbi:carcinoembryonic antigen-related cell adhesion molecule 7-like isoform X2 [Stegostoma tigrinum]|uniref:carcinoembryonic antigen-related cell adhesion molecule 7-like isoform X2 n=1 Tax=Stegostoma tigrinum TaxID=3053191 RepID=UPI0028706BB2|nr:carcinoembryonic antigen-related cell adhesion molecule 7-like isoform X2 [Stegostoma tigrinum]
MKIYFVFVLLFTQLHLSESKVPEESVILAAAGSDVTFPGPEHPETYTRSVWIFYNHIISDVVSFSKVSEPRIQIRKKYKSRIQPNATTLTLVLQNVEESDTGIYKLFSRQHVRTISEVTLHVYKLLGESRISSNSSQENSTIALTCAVSGKVESVMWLAITDSAAKNRYTLIYDNTTLVIQNAQKSDSGIYGCFIRNPFSKSSAFYELTVKLPVAVIS